MRRTLLIILVFVPGLFAWILYRGLGSGDDTGVRRVDEGEIASGVDAAADALTGFEGRGTFYRQLERAKLEGKTVSYARTLYLLDGWQRRGSGTFDVEGLLIVQNPRPRALEDLEGLLPITNAMPADERRQRLEEARLTRNSLRAARALASGGENVTKAERLQLEGGIEAVIPTRREDGSTFVLRGERADIGLNEGSLQRLEIPDAFEIVGPEWRLSGGRLEALHDSYEIVVRRDPKVESVGRGEPMRFFGSGPMIWHPDDDVPGRPRSVLDRARFDFGRLEVTGGIEAKVGRVSIRAREMIARIGDRRGRENPGRLESIRMRGEVRLKTSRGVVRGDDARLSLTGGGALSVVMEGKQIELEWQRSRDGDRAVRNLLARSRGPLRIDVPERESRTTKPLIITMRDDVTLELVKDGGLLVVRGESLVVSLDQILEHGEEADEHEAWRLQKLVMRGNVRGTGRGRAFETPKLTLARRYNENGVPVRDELAFEGPAWLESPGGLGRGGPDAEGIRTRITAMRRLGHVMPARNGGPAESSAEGHVTVREKGASKNPRTLEAEWLRVAATATGDAEVKITEVEARGSVAAVDENGSRLNGSSLKIDREAGMVVLEGGPAACSFVDANGRRQSLRALRFELSAKTSTVDAIGSVDGVLRLPSAVFTDDLRDKEEQREDVDWKMSAASARVVFSGRLPLATRGMVDGRLEPIEVVIQGPLRLENPDQALTGNLLRHDLRTRTGILEGSPARMLVTRDVGGVTLRDKLEAPRFLVERSWTLVEGPASALLHVRREGREDRRDPSTWEPMRVQTAREVLVRGDTVVFSGRTLLERGVVKTGGLRLEADEVTVHFDPDRRGGGRPRRIESIDATGDVQIARRELRGQGDSLRFDLEGRKVRMSAKEGTCRIWQEGRSFVTRGQVVEHDLERKVTTVIEASGSTDGP